MAKTAIFLAREHDRDRLRRDVRSGTVARVRRGAYIGPERLRARDHFVVKIRAMHQQLQADHVFSHGAAAVLHGLPMWTLPTRVDLIQRYRAGGSSARDVARHRLELAPDQITMISGIPVTSLARTVVDCALTLHPMEALVVADAACRASLDVEESLTILRILRNRRGTAVARRIITCADPGAQSVWESRTRYVLLRAGVPGIVTQMPVPTRLGTFHTDLGIPEFRIGIEFDGMAKYRTGTYGPGHDGAQELFREKRRGDAIAEALTLVRTTASEPADAFTDRVARHLPPEIRQALRAHPRMRPVQ